MEFPPLEWVFISINCRKLQVSGNFVCRESSEDSIFMSHHTSFVTTLALFTLVLNCSRACYLNSQFPSIIHVFSKLYRTIIAEKKEIKLSSSNFRYFRYAKYRISIFLKYRYLSKISIYRISLLLTFFTVLIIIQIAVTAISTNDLIISYQVRLLTFFVIYIPPMMFINYKLFTIASKSRRNYEISPEVKNLFLWRIYQVAC